MSTLFSLLSNCTNATEVKTLNCDSIYEQNKEKKDLKIDALNLPIIIVMTVGEKYVMKVLHKLKNDDLRVNCDSEPLQLPTASQYSCER